ncbi:uncharacterized protein LOC110730023 [Chenopodium quinoa]|uniref:uncharacterized protein LOC110730023 n=1 Tax=Chenopodium quinoa TaxID=63459 RepID=UPI000B773DC4|nr:uncharacterized protein LOC110730023 [Chenopodium quinoa]
MSCKISRFSYQKLRKEVILEEEDAENKKRVIKTSSFPKITKWFGNKLRKRKLKFKFSGFRRFFKVKSRIKVARFRLSWVNKVLKRLKESQSHFGDLFAGNYLVMQVTPTDFNKKNTNKNTIIVGNPYGPNNKITSFAHFTYMY